MSPTARYVALLCASATAMYCAPADTAVEYEPYGGPPAFPDRRAKLPSPKGYFAYVSNSRSDTITVLDFPSHEVVAEVSVGRDPVDIDGPHHLAVDARGFVYVALSYPAALALPGPHAEHSTGVRSGYVLKLAPDDLHRVGEVQIDPNPGDIAVTADGTRVIVTHFDLTRAADPKLDAEAQKATLMVVQSATLGAPGSPPPTATKVCRAPHGLALAPDGRTAYVACYADDVLAIVDLTSTTTTPSRVPVGSKGPYSAVLSPSGQLVAVGSTDGKETRILDTTTRAMKPATVVTQGAPYFAAWSADEMKLWIPTQSPDALVLADATNGAVRAQRVFDTRCVRPHEAVSGRGETVLYLVCEGDHVSPGAVLALDPVTLETRATMPVGVYPDRLVLGKAP